MMLQVPLKPSFTTSTSPEKTQRAWKIFISANCELCLYLLVSGALIWLLLVFQPNALLQRISSECWTAGGVGGRWENLRSWRKRVQNKMCTCAPWRTRMSVPLLSIDIRATSSTSASCDRRSFRGFEKSAFSSCINSNITIAIKS